MNLSFYRYTIIIPFLLLLAGCSRNKPAVDPCEGLLNEHPPVQIVLQFREGSTGDNFLLKNQLQPADITVKDINTQKTINNWRLAGEQSMGSPLLHVLFFWVFNETPGVHTYEINLKSFATANLAYTVTKVSTEDRCRPVVFPVGDIKVTDHSFSPFVHDGKTNPNILIVEL